MINIMDDKMKNALTKLQPKVTKTGRTRSEISKANNKRGKQGERFFVDKLSEVTGENFMRVPSSGAYVGSSNRKRLVELSKSQGIMTLGDIIPPDGLKYRLIAEVKNYSSLDTHNFLSEKNSKVMLTWLDENLYDVESAIMIGQTNIISLLFIKLKQKGNYVVGNIKNLESKLQHKLPMPHLLFEHKVKNELSKEYGDVFFICDFGLWLALNAEQVFMQMNDEELTAMVKTSVERNVAAIKNKQIYLE